MTRARRVRRKKTQPVDDSPSLVIPGPDDITVPSNDLRSYMAAIFGTKGVGKTTLGAHWLGDNSLVIMAEPMRKNLAIRQMQLKTHTAQDIMDGKPDTWEQLKEVTQDIVDDDTIENVSFDTIDLVYEMCMHSVSARNMVTNPSKAGKESSAVWIELRDEFKAYFDTLRETGMGILLISHTKEREIESVDGSMMAQQAPSAAPACLQYVKSACDFAFMYGYYNNRRCLTIRDETNNVWTGCGRQDRFCQPDGKPISHLELPNDPDGVFPVIESAWGNNEWDMDTEEEDRVTEAKPRKKRRRRAS